MFKKISAVVAFVGLMLSGITPAVAVPMGSNPGALNMAKHTVTKSRVSGSTNDRTFTVVVPNNAQKITFATKFMISAAATTRLSENGGTTMTATLTATGPSGQQFVTNTNPSQGPYVSTLTQWMHGSNYIYEPTKLFTSPGSVSHAYMNIAIGNEYWESNVVPAGTYTFTVSLKAAGIEVAPQTYDMSADTIGLTQADTSLLVSGQPTVAYETGSAIKPNFDTCLDTTRVSVGDSIRVRHFIAGVQKTSNTETYWERRSNPTVSLGNFATRPAQGPSAETTETYVITEPDKTSGIKIENTYWTETIADGSTIQTYDLSLFNETTSEEVSMSCLPTAPAKPVLVFGGRTYFTVAVNTSGLPARTWVRGELYKASDTQTVVARCSTFNSEVSSNSVCYGNMNHPGVDLATDYVVRVRVETDADGAGAWSVLSDAAQVSGPQAPTNAPVLARTSISSADVTITPIPGVNYYEIGIFSSTDLTSELYTSECRYDAPNCRVNGPDLFVAPGRYVAKYRAVDNNQLSSNWSPASNEVEGVAAGTTLTTTPSGLSTPGKVRVSTPNFGSILATSNTNFAAGNDGRGGQLWVSRSEQNGSNTFTLGRLKNDSDSLDSTIGGGSPLTWTVSGSSWQLTAPAWFGSDKQSWSHVFESGSTAKITVGTLGSSAVTTSTANFNQLCSSNVTNSSGGGNVQAIAAPTTRPMFLVDCELEDGNGMSTGTALVAARLSANGSLEYLGTLTESGATDYQRVFTEFGSKRLVSVNPNATGSQIAIVVYVATLINSSTPTADPWDPQDRMRRDVSAKKLVRIPANADEASDFIKVDSGIAEGTNEDNLPETKLAPLNDGTNLYLINTLYTPGVCTPQQNAPPQCGPGTMSNKLYAATVASGGFGAAKNITSQGGGGDYSFADGYHPNATSGGVTELAILVSRFSCMSNPCTASVGLGRIIATTGVATSVELIGSTQSGTPVDLTWLNDSGNLKRLITEPNATGHKILETKSLLGYVATPVVPVALPTIQSFDVTASIDAGGGTVTIIGTNLANVQKIAFGAYEFAPASKSATKVTFKVPSKVAAGGQASVQVAIRYGTGAGTLMPTNRTFTYVGATKLPLAITLNTGADTYLPGAQPRNVVASLSSGNNPVLLPVTVVSKTVAICTVVQGQLTFVSNGKCIVEATQPGNAGYEAATKVTKEIWVTPDYDGASTLYSTDAAKPSVTLTGTGLSSVTSVELVNPADPTEKITVTGSANIKANATGTQLTVKLPAAGVLAGDAADIKLVWGPNTTTPIATGDTFEFVGATKLNQVIDFATVGLPATYGDAIRTLAPVSKDGSTVLDVVVALKSTTPTVCSVTGYAVRFLSNGACKIVASQAGNAGINKAADVTMQFQVSKKAQVITIEDTTLSTTDAAEAISSGASVDNAEMALEYVSGNEEVCTIDGAGFITGLQVTNGTDKRCVITVKQLGDNRYSAAPEQTLEVTITSAADPSDEAASEGDGVLNPAPIANGGPKTFTATNDAGFELSWDKANGKLIPRAKGVYTGFIQAKLTFIKNGVSYTCSVVFGSNAAMKNSKAAEKKAAKALKTFTTKNAFCADPNEIKPALLAPVGGLSRANFAKIKPTAKDAKAAATVAGSKKYEAAALAQLKGFTGQVTIEIKRFRAWPTTGVNFTGDKSKTTGGKKIPVTTRTTRVTLG